MNKYWSTLLHRHKDKLLPDEIERIPFYAKDDAHAKESLQETIPHYVSPMGFRLISVGLLTDGGQYIHEWVTPQMVLNKSEIPLVKIPIGNI